MMFCRRPFYFLILISGLLLSTQGRAADALLQFNRDIRPILSENCFACHGFDAKKRKADLRLDTPEGAYGAIEGGFPIKPGDLAKSSVWQRVVSTDEDEMMPPPESHKKLTEAQKETIKRWIEQGAAYQRHWAYERPVKPKGATSIDGWLTKRLAAEGLTMDPEADRPTLIRRVSFALTGLPPALAEVDAFVKDASPTAYEALVDRYMKSPRFGEEMARHWLDVARYADTHGLHLDNERSMWAYRDWVVKAFNENLPFDQFTVWQIGGDLLPNATPDQITATGFSRCNVTTSEGGAIDEEYRHLYAVDRAATLTQAWMGITGGCAQCHDHKFDPLTMKEFYSLYAFFYSGADPAMDKNIASTEPFLKLPRPGQREALDAAIQREGDALAALDEAAVKVSYTDPGTLNPEPGAETVTTVIFDDSFPVGAEVKNTSRNPSEWLSDPVYGARSGNRVLRHAGSQFIEDTMTFSVKPVVLPEQARISIWARLDPLNVPRVLSIVLDGRRVFWGTEDALDGSSFGAITNAVHMGPLPKPGVWTQLIFDPAALEMKPGTRLTRMSVQQVGGVVAWDLCTVTGEVQPARDPLASFIVWWKGAGKKPSIDVPEALKALLAAGPDAPRPKAAEPKTVKDEADRAALLTFYLARIAHPASDEVAGLRNAWQTAQANRAAVDAAIPGTMVFGDLATPRDTFMALRGQYTKLGDKVEPAVPAAFAPLKKVDPQNRATRLDLAQWLVSPDHPLTARVAVNRLWQQMFGVGLVKTSHDFGSQGEPPSHPELLDWLAVSFRESGWDVKALIRSMVTSRAFRGQSAVTPESLQRDRDNRLLARGPRFRLDAEQIRDNALYVSGLINLDMGGRGVRTYQPPNIWEPVGYGDSNTRYYLQDHGSALYRRSLYCFLKRTAPPPFMSNFDAPNREQSCNRRERSNTPMQALQLLNDVQHFEAARALAERALAEGGSDDAARLGWLFRTVLARTPDAKEAALLTEALADQRDLCQKDPDAAAKTIRTGESPPKMIATASETAAWTMIANLVLNLDETVTRN